MNAPRHVRRMLRRACLALDPRWREVQREMVGDILMRRYGRACHIWSSLGYGRMRFAAAELHAAYIRNILETHEATSDHLRRPVALPQPAATSLRGTAKARVYQYMFGWYAGAGHRGYEAGRGADYERGWNAGRSAGRAAADAECARLGVTLLIVHTAEKGLAPGGEPEGTP